MPHLRLPTGPSILLVCFHLIVTAGCALEGEPEPGLETVAITDDCPTWGCNSNSPVVDGSPIHELDEGPAPAALLPGPVPDQGGGLNSWGTRLVRLDKGGVSYRVDVRGDRLRALDATGEVALEAAALVGSTIVLERFDGSNLYVFIDTFHDTLRFWVGRAERIQTFRLTWSTLPAPPPGHERRTVCRLVTDTVLWKEAAAHEAIFFQGDRYDGPSKQVIATGAETGGWFNVACAGGVPAKMHANRHTVAGSAAGFDASPLDKQALLKALTADYCGTGKSFTEVDEPLTWQNHGDWKVLAPLGSYESVWDSTGALCLTIPRMGDSHGELVETQAAIEEECELPPKCDTLGAFPKGWKDEGYVLTANPM